MNQELEELLERALRDLGFELVRFKKFSQFGREIYEVMIDHLDFSAVTISDCQMVSRKLSLILDVNEAISEKYTFDVTSPGIDRPLIKLEHFKRFIGEEAKVQLHNLQENIRNFEGKILKLEEDNIYFEVLKSLIPITVKYENIKAAKLVPKINFNINTQQNSKGDKK